MTREINWYEMRVYFLKVEENKDGLPKVLWYPVGRFDVTSKRKRRFYNCSAEQSEILTDFENIILGYTKSESTALMYRFYGDDEEHKSKLLTITQRTEYTNLIKVMAWKLIEYGRESILLEYGVRDGVMEASQHELVERSSELLGD